MPFARRFHIALATILGLGATRVALAAPDQIVAEVPFGVGMGSHAIVTEGRVELCGGFPEGCSPDLALFFAPITNASAGTTFWLDSSAPHFDGLVALISNGIKDPLSDFFFAGGGSGHSQFDTGFFGDQVGPGGVDLAGFAIHRIGYRVDAISLVSPGSDPVHDGIWTDASIQGAFLFEAGCSLPPSVETLTPLVVNGGCSKVFTVTLAAPAAGSVCSDTVTITGNVISSSPAIPIVNGQVSLPPGTHTVEWTADDGFGTASSLQTVTVARHCPGAEHPPHHRHHPRRPHHGRHGHHGHHAHHSH